MPMINTWAQALIDRLRERLERESPQAPGIVIQAENSMIDDGQYGDPHIDRRPDFIQKDDAGWTRLNDRWH